MNIAVKKKRNFKSFSFLMMIFHFFTMKLSMKLKRVVFKIQMNFFQMNKSFLRARKVYRVCD